MTDLEITCGQSFDPYNLQLGHCTISAYKARIVGDIYEGVHKAANDLVEEVWYQSFRVRHTSQGQEKRDLFRFLGKLAGVPQVGMPTITFVP